MAEAIAISGNAPVVAVLMPVYNEAGTIAPAIQAVLRQPCVSEVIITDDASTDESWELIQRIQMSDRRIKATRHDVNRGKGAALRTAIEYASAPIVIVQDADLEYDPNDYSQLVGPIANGKADVVYGSRFAGSGARRMMYFWHYVGNRLLTLLANMFTNLNLTDMETGYKVFRREVIDGMTIRAKRFDFEPEFTAKVLKRKYRIFEVPISFNPRDYSQGKKIKLRDAFEAVWTLLKYRFID